MSAVSPEVVWKLTYAPYMSSIRTMMLWSFSAANMSAVWWFFVHAFTRAP